MEFLKTFFTFFTLVMKSQRGSLGAEAIDDSSGIEKYMDDANLESLGAEDSTEVGSEGQSQGNPDNVDNGQTPGDGKPSLEDQLAAFEKDAEGKDGENNALLDQLNALGILRNGMPVEFSNPDEVKEYLSKGYDYTQKTQELANQRREQEEALTQRQQEIEAKYEEAETFQRENQDKILENQVMEQVLAEIQANDPDIFNEIANSFRQKMSMFSMQQNNPMFKGVNDKLSALEKQLQQTTQEKQKQEAQGTLKEWEDGLSSVQKDFGVKLKGLGIKPNWEKVQKAWQSDASNSTTVKEAFFAVHGDQIAKALEAQAKLNQTRAKSAQRMGPQSGGTTGSTDQAPSQHGSGSYMADIEKIAARYI